MSWIWAKRRQLMWIATAILIVIPLVYPLGLPIPVTDEVKLAFKYIDSLPEGSKVLFEAETGASYWYELGVGQAAITKHCFKKDLKLYYVHFGKIPDAPDTTERAIKIALNAVPGKVRGVDYVNLGYVPGAVATMTLFSEDVRRVVSYDHFHTTIDEIPMMEGINDISDFDMVICSRSEASGAVLVYPKILAPLGIKFIALELTGDVPNAMPYRTSGLIDAIIGGSAGNAQYEYLIAEPGRAMSSMDVQNVIQVFMLAVALSSNIPLILQRLKGVEKL